MKPNKIQKLTAYEMKFGIWRSKNNSHKEDLKSKMQNGESINANLNHLLELFVKNINKNSIGEKTGYIIKIEDAGESCVLNNGFKRTMITPNSGRRDQNTIMYNISSENTQKQNYDDNWVATHPRNIIFYEKDGKTYAIFHRVGGSGCKSVFKQAANELLREEGLALQMDLMLSESGSENYLQYAPDSIILIKQESTNHSTDLADQLVEKKKYKKTTSKKLVLNLGYGFNKTLGDALSKYRFKQQTKEETITIIKDSINDFDDYTDMKVELRIGNAKRIVDWNDIEKIVDGYDITETLKEMGGNSKKNLLNCSDNYVFNVVKIGE